MNYYLISENIAVKHLRMRHRNWSNRITR